MLRDHFLADGDAGHDVAVYEQMGCEQMSMGDVNKCRDKLRACVNEL